MNVIISQIGRFLTKGNTDTDFTQKLIAQLCNLHPTCTFFYLTFDKQECLNPLPVNVKKITISIPMIAMPVKTRWYKLKLKEQVKQLKIEIILHIDDYLTIPEMKEWLLLTGIPDYKPEHLKPLKGIIVPNPIIKQSLLKEGIEPSSIRILRCIPDNRYTPIDWDARELSKQQIADGNEYLLFDAVNASQAHFLNVLKGFSVIKKWLKTNIKLIIINVPLHKNTDNLLNSYKYKQEVSILKETNNYIYQDLLSAAFIFIYLPQSSVNVLPLLQSMQSGIPAITCKNDFFSEACNDGVVYINPDSEDEIGEKLMKLCKDEKTRNALVQKSMAQLEALKINNNASIFE